jgi:hypothetical protein
MQKDITPMPKADVMMDLPSSIVTKFHSPEIPGDIYRKTNNSSKI